jgi:hypothetical protein
MNELKWTLGDPCIRSLRNKQSPAAVVPETMTLSNKREIANEKMNERHMISQISQNPFLAKNTYLEDLDIQENFLKPKNSNFGLNENEG